MSDLRSGDRLGGYSILRKLGAGGMGVVYLARDETLDRELAVKLLGSADPALLEEARLAARLEHPAIVPVYAAGEDDGRLFLAMRYVPGGTLQQRLVAGPLDGPPAVRVLAAIADALDTAHRAGLVHRDVKPANILLDGDRASLADFGLARRDTSVAASVRAGIVPGTIGYVAPEQIEGDAFDGRADQYALACVAFECLTGQQPFARGSDLATIYAHLSDPAPRASALRPLPVAVDDALARALAKQAADRFESCTAFVTAVGGALDGRVAVASGSAPSSTDAVQSVDAASGRVAAADIRRKLVTVVFCDLSRSLALSEEADAESQRAITMGYFAEIRAAVITHGGIVERSAGDTVVAVFGIPTAHEDDALRAVRAAFGIRQRLAALAADRRFEAIPEVRIGVNTGEVATSPAAADEPIAVGNTLNVARRLEERAASGEIVLGELTQRLTRDAVTVDPVPRPANGDPRPVPAYRALAIVGDTAGVPRRLRSGLVGRRPQLAALGGLYRACCQSGRPQIAALVGEPGAGKTRLAYEFVQSAADATILHGRCHSYGEAITYAPLAQAIRQLAAATAGETPAEVAERIRGLVPADPSAAEFLAVAAGVSPIPASPEELAWATRTLLATLARAGPVVVVLDDLQWAEPLFLDLLGSLGAVEAPVLLLCLARTEIAEQPAWRDLEGGRTQLTVERLTDHESGELVRELLSRDTDDALVARLTEAAGGNPLFLEELCEMLVDTGEAAPIDARRVPRPEGRPVALPVTLDALITSRLDLLPAAERLAIEIAAVEGTVFTREAVLALAPASVRGEVTPAIDGLVRRDLARPTTVEGAPALRFRHVLVRDAAYRGIAKVRRADAHERFARWLERASPERPEADETIGYHLEQACRYRSELGGAGAELRALGADAATRLERAARRARTRGDGPAAVRLLRRATAVLPDADVQRGRLLVELGATLVDDGRLGDAQAALDAAGGVAGAARDPALDARLAVERLVTDFQVDTAAVVARTAAATGALAAAFTRAADDEGLCRLAHLEAMVNWVEGQVAAAETSWARSADIARRLGNAVRLADVLSWIPSAALYGPMPVAEAIPRCEQVSAELQGSRRAEAEVLGPLAALFAMQGAFERARSLIARRAAVIAEVGFAMHSVGEWAAQVELLAGDPRAAEVHLRAGFERLDEIGERGFLATTAALLARALQDQGRDDEAFAFTEVCEQTASRDDLAAQIAWRGIRARILATRRQTAEAVALASEAVALAERTDLLSDHGDALLDLTQCLRAAGRSGDATETARAARALYHRKGNMVASDRAQAVLHELVPV